MAKARNPEHGLSLVELLVGVALVGLVALGISRLVENSEHARSLLSSKADAEAELNTMFQRATQYFRTRMTSRPDNGFKIAACASPGPSTACLDIFRRTAAGSSSEAVEQFRFKSACRPLTPREQSSAARLKLDLAKLGKAMTSVCGVTCPAGQKPIIYVRHWPDASRPGSSREFEVPKGRFGAAHAIAAGFCARRRGPDEVQLDIAVAYPRDENGWTTQLVRRQTSIPLAVDASEIEWVP